MRGFITIAVIVLHLVSGTSILAQNVGIGTNNPDASAKLEVQSTSQGLLIPRMTQAQRNSIVSPATGLMIFQTDQAMGTYYYNGSKWLNLSDNLGNHTASQILDMDTNRIINVSAPVQGLDAVNKDYVDAAVGSGGGTAGNIGAGMPTEISKRSLNPMNGMDEAIVYCDTLTENGHSDWVMPNRDQLMYAITGGCVMPDQRYSNYIWTRSEYSSSSGNWAIISPGGGWVAANSGSSTSYYIRCVR